MSLHIPREWAIQENLVADFCLSRPNKVKQLERLAWNDSVFKRFIEELHSVIELNDFGNG